MSLRDDLLGSLDGILGIRDDLGVSLKVVNIVTRTWTGTEPGDGDAEEEAERILPSPKVVEFAHDARLQSGGSIQQGDILLKYISRNAYPNLTDIDCSSNSLSVEKFYELSGILYQVIHVKEELLTWTVQVRRLSAQTRY